ncbi:MAG: DUF1295 domain-containing protein [Elusimicrobiales bacterium]
MKYRIKISQAVTVALLLAARPCSWTLFFAGLAVAAAGEALRIWASGNLYKDKTLAVGGPFQLARHPLYVGSSLIAAGFTVMCVNPAYPYRSAALALSVILGFMFVYSATANEEEARLSQLFGAEYESYRNSVPKYLPCPSAFGAALRTDKFSLSQMLYNKEQITMLGFASIAGIVALMVWRGLSMAGLVMSLFS